jgi:hypothetical protein
MPAASISYKKSLKIRETLAARDPAHTGRQRALAVSCEKIDDYSNGSGRSSKRFRLPQKKLGN